MGLIKLTIEVRMIVWGLFVVFDLHVVYDIMRGNHWNRSVLQILRELSFYGASLTDCVIISSSAQPLHMLQQHIFAHNAASASAEEVILSVLRVFLCSCLSLGSLTAKPLFMRVILLWERLDIINHLNKWFNHPLTKKHPWRFDDNQDKRHMPRLVFTAEKINFISDYYCQEILWHLFPWSNLYKI